MTEFRTLLEGAAEDSWTLLSGNRPIDVALARTVANFSNDGTTTYANDTAVVTAMGTSQSNLSAFSGAAIDWENLRVVFHGGGHADSGDGSLFGFDIEAAATSLNASSTKGDWALKKKSARYRLDENGFPSWTTQLENSDYAAWENADGDRHWISCHTYAFNGYVGNGTFDIGGSAAYGGNASDRIGAVWTYDWDTNAASIYHHDPTVYAASLTYTLNGWGCADFAPWEYNRYDGKVYTLADVTINFANPFFRWDRENKDRDGEGYGANDYIGNSSIPGRSRQRAVILPDPGDSSKRIFWQHRTNSDYIVVRDIERTDALCTTENRNYGTALSPTDSMLSEYSGYTYDSARSVIARWGGDGRVYHLALDSNFDSWDWAEFTSSPTGTTPPGGGSIYDGFEYIPAHDCYIAVDRNKDVYVYKPSAWAPKAEGVVSGLGLYGGPAKRDLVFTAKTAAGGTKGAGTFTRLGLYGGPRQRYEAFEAKTPAAGGKGDGLFTRLGLYGGPRQRYGQFEAKAPAEQVDERNRGGWIDPAVLRRLRKQAEGDKRKPYDAKKRKERERVAELSALYDEITGTEIAEEVADVIRPVAKTEAVIPARAQIDMTALARNVDMLRQLERIVTEYAEQQEDEELLLLALVN